MLMVLCDCISPQSCRPPSKYFSFSSSAYLQKRAKGPRTVLVTSVIFCELHCLSVSCGGLSVDTQREAELSYWNLTHLDV